MNKKLTCNGNGSKVDAVKRKRLQNLIAWVTGALIVLAYMTALFLAK
jgi:hypothetical protein